MLRCVKKLLVRRVELLLVAVDDGDELTGEGELFGESTLVSFRLDTRERAVVVELKSGDEGVTASEDSERERREREEQDAPLLEVISDQRVHLVLTLLQCVLHLLLRLGRFGLVLLRARLIEGL